MNNNICFFNSLKVWGGGEKFYFEFALGFHQLGYKIILACNKNSRLSAKAKENKIHQHNISVGNLSFFNPIKVFNIVRFYKKNKISTVIFSTSQDLKTGGIAAKIAGVKKIVYRRGLATPIKNSFLNRYLLGKAVTLIISNSEETKRTILHNLSNYIPENKIKVIYNGIRPENYAPDIVGKIDEIKKRGKGIILGNAGRLTDQKGQKYLIDIAENLKAKNIEFTLFIAGSGILKENLEKLVEERGLENDVILLDFVDNIGAFMNSIDIFLLSSMWEGFGYVLAEAMMFSKPIVAYNITSNPEIVSNNETGFLVDFNNLNNFTQKVELLIKDENLRQKMGNAGFKRVIENFKFEKQLKILESTLCK